MLAFWSTWSRFHFRCLPAAQPTLLDAWCLPPCLPACLLAWWFSGIFFCSFWWWFDVCLLPACLSVCLSAWDACCFACAMCTKTRKGKAWNGGEIVSFFKYSLSLCQYFVSFVAHDFLDTSTTMWLPDFFLRLKVLELRTAPHRNLIGQLGRLEPHPPDPTYWQAIRYVMGVKNFWCELQTVKYGAEALHA